MQFLHVLEGWLTENSFLFYLVDQSLFMVNCSLMILILFQTPLWEKKRALWIIPTVALSALAASLLSDGVVAVDIRVVFLFFLPFAGTFILFKKPPVWKHFAVVFACGILAGSIKYLLGIIIPVEDVEKTIELCTDLLLLIVILIVYAAVHNKEKPAETLSHLNAFTFLWVCLTVVFFILTIIILRVEYRDSPYIGVLYVNVVLFVSLVSYIIYSMLKAKQSEAYFRRALDAEIRQFEIIGEKDEDLRRFRHDYANHMRCIAAMIENGQADDVKAYVEKLGVNLQSTTRDFYTGNYMLDIILAEKRSLARRDGNDVLFEGSFPKSGIRSDDICTIMANALDNAVEACRGMQDRCEINVKSIAKEDEVAVSIINPVASKTRIIAGSVATSKSDTSRHGYGLKSIKKTVEKYDGYMHLSSEHQTFELFFNLKIKSIC